MSPLLFTEIAKETLKQSLKTFGTLWDNLRKPIISKQFKPNTIFYKQFHVYCFLMSNQNSRTFVDYLHFERENEKKTLQKCRQQIRLYKSSFNICSETIDFIFHHSEEKMSSPSPTSPSTLATSIIMYRLIGTLQSIQTLTLKGYYYEAKVLMRNFGESLGLCAYLKDNPIKAAHWLQGEKINISSIKLFSQMEKIFLSKKTKTADKSTYRFYGNLCNYVHSNITASLDIIVKEIKQKATDGQPITALTLQLPKFDSEEVDEVPHLAITMALGIFYVFEDELPIEKKVKLLRFIRNHVSKLPHHESTKPKRLRIRIGN